jgi:hypothetical protein
MPPRYVINSLTRQTIDTTVKFAPSISSPCATVETAEGFANLAAVPGNPLYVTASKTLEATIANTALVVGGVTLGLGERFFLVFGAANQSSGGVYALTKLAGGGNAWEAVRAADFNSDQAIVLGSHIYAINQGNLAGQFIALENKTQIVLDTTAIEASLAGTPNQAVGTSFLTETGQSFVIAGNAIPYALPTLQSGQRRRVEVNIYGSNNASSELFLQQSNLVAVNPSGTSIGQPATPNPLFSFFNVLVFDDLAVTYLPGVGGDDSVLITNAAQIQDLFATVQITVWDTSIT